MFDAKLRPLIDPPLNHIGRSLARLGIGANAVVLTDVPDNSIAVGIPAVVKAKASKPGT